MGIQRLQPQSIAPDLSKAVQIIRNGNYTATDNYSTIYSVNGKGFINKMVAMSNNPSYYHNVRITVDDIVVFEVQGNSGQAMGILLAEYLALYNTAPYVGTSVGGVGVQTSSPRELGYINTVDRLGGYASLSAPLFFNKNIKIEVKSQSAGVVFAYTVLGGLL